MASYDSDVTIRIDADTANAESALSRLQSAMDKAYKSPQASMRQMGVQADKLLEKLKLNTDAVKEFERYKKAYQIVSPEEIQRAQELQTKMQKLQETKNRLDAQPGYNKNNPYYTTTVQNLASVTEEYNKINKAQQDAQRILSEGALKYGNKFDSSFVDRQYANATRQNALLTEQASILSQRIGEAHSKLGNIAKLLGTVFKKTASVFKSIGSHIKEHITKHNQDTTKSFRGLLKQVLKYGLGIRSLFLLYKKLRQYGKEAFKDMATQYPVINAQISDLVSTFSQMTHSIATAFQPLLSVVIPILNAVMNAAIAAANAIGSFFAAITGQGFIYKAIKQQKNFAGAIGGTGGAAKDAKEELAEYDKLLVIDQDNAGGGGGGGGAGGGGTEFFEKSPLMESAANLAQMIKDAWKDADFTDVGTLIGNKLTVALNSIPWDGIQKTAGKVGKSIATFLNGFISPDLFSSIGNTIAQAINTGIEAGAEFVRNFDFKNLGTSLATGINTLIQNLHTEKLAITIHDFIAKASNGASEFFTKTDFNNLGTKIAGFFNTIIQPDSLGALGKALANAVNGAIHTASGLIKNLNFKQIGVSIATGISNFISTVDWKDLASVISKGIGGVLQTAAGFIRGLDTRAIWQAIIDFVSGIDWLSLAGSILELLWSALELAIEAPATLVTTLVDNLEELFYEGFEALGELGWDGFWEGVWGALTDLATWIGEKVEEYIIQPFKDALGIASPSKVFAEIGGYAMEGLLNGLKLGFELVKTWVLGAVDWLSKNFGEPVVEMGAKILGLDPDPLSTANKEAEENAKRNEMIRKGLEIKFEGKKNGLTAWEAQAEYIKQTFKDIQTVSDETAEVIDKGFNGMPSQLTQYAKQSYKGAKKSFEKSEEWAENTASGISKGFNGMPSEIESKFRSAYERSSDEFKGINQKAQQWSNSTVKGFNGMPSGIENLYRQSYQRGTYQFSEINTWATSTKDKAVSGFNGMPSEIQAKFKSSYDNGTSQFTNINTWSKGRSDTAVAGFNGMPSGIANRFQNAYKDSTAKWNGTKDWSNATFQTVVSASDTKMKQIPGIFSDSFKSAANSATTQVKNFKDWYDGVTFGVKQLSVAVNQGAIDGATAAIQGLSNYWVDKSATYTVKAEGLDAIAKSVDDIVTDLGKAAATAAAMKITAFHGSKAGMPSSVPGMATGGVLPPNHPFLALVGDQTQGTNVETPLSTMIEAFNKALDDRGGTNAPIELKVDGKTLARVVWDENEKKYKQTGRYNPRYS